MTAATQMRTHARIEELEPRILYSIDSPLQPADLAVAPAPEIRAVENYVERAASAEATQVTQQESLTHELVFIDSNIAGYQELVADAQAQNNANRAIEVIVIGQHEDGLKLITDTLAARSDVSAVHVISHGADGSVQLGNVRLNDASLSARAKEIAAWGQSFTAHGDILFYGCDLAAAADGKLFVDKLAALTGTDVAASDNPTGSAGEGGDWNLEYRNGSIATTLAVSSIEQSQWTGLLVNSAPVLSGANNFTTITEDQTTNSGDLVSTLIAGKISDADAGSVQGIAITSRNSGNGTWQYSTNGGSTWNSVGSVSTGNALLLAPTDMLRLVPDGQNGGSASITFRAWDQTSGTHGTKVDATTNGGVTAFSSSTATSNLTVTSVNDAPTLGSSPLASVAINTASPAGQTVSTIFSGQFSDVDNGSNLGGIAVVGNTANAGTEGSWQYSSNGGGNWFDVGSVADGPTALAISSTSLIRFVPVTGYSGAPPSLVIRGVDNSYAGGFSTTSGSESRIAVDTTTSGGFTAIAAVTANLSTYIDNSAPVLSGAIDFTTITEDQTNNSGQLVSTLIAGQVSDADAGSGQGIAITGKVSGNGSWSYSLDNGNNWSSVGNVSTGSALLLRSSDMLRFNPDGDNGTTASITFCAWDQTSGNPGNKVSTTTNGGVTAFSTTSATSNITVSSLNDAPSLNNGTLAAVLEDTANPAGQTVATIFSGKFSDVDTVSSFSGIAVVGNTANAGTQGVWQYSTNGGTNWFAIGAVADGATALAIDTTTLIRFLPVADFDGAPTALTLRALDDTYAGSFSSTAGVESRVNVNTSSRGGTTPISFSATLSTTITSVNDAPVGTSNTVTALEDTAYAFTAADFGFTDPHDSPVNTLLNVKITTLPGAGTLTLSGVAVTTGQLVSVASINAGNLQFTAAANANGAGYAAFTFQVQDDGGTANGGADLDTVARILTVNVTAVNDTPVITSDGAGATAAVNVAENSTAVTTVTATDPDLPAQTLSYSITGGADAAKFTVNSSTGVLSFISAPNYEAPTDAGADNVYDVTVQVSDGTLTDSQAIAVTVTAVNDNTPVITSDGAGATAAVNVAENSTAVTTVTASDADLPTQTLSYSITGGADAANFTVNSSTGVLSFISAPNYEVPTDAGADNVYDVIVQVSDGSLTDNQAIAVTVTPLNENAPTITSDGAGATALINVTENTLAVTTVTATDADLPAPSLSYSITGGADAAKFTVNSSSGVLSFISAPNYEAPADAGADNVYDVTVQVSDGSLTDNQAIAVTVTNVNEAPQLTVNALAVAPGATVVLNASNVAASDVDTAAVALTFSVSSVSSGQFELASAPGAPIVTFTQAQVGASAVRFVHDGSSNAPTYSVTVSDGTLSDGPHPAAVTFNTGSTSGGTPVISVPSITSSAPPAPATTPSDSSTTAKPSSAAVVTQQATSENFFGPELLPRVLDSSNAETKPSEIVFQRNTPSQIAVATSTWVREMTLPVAASSEASKETMDNWTSGLNRSLRVFSITVEGSSIVAAADSATVLNAAPASERESTATEIHFTPAKLTSVLATAGVVWWAGRAGALLTGLLTTGAAWRRFDPLPVVHTGTDDDVAGTEPSSDDLEAQSAAKIKAAAATLASLAPVASTLP